jgi:hypothetical protein
MEHVLHFSIENFISYQIIELKKVKFNYFYQKYAKIEIFLGKSCKNSIKNKLHT